MRKFTLVFSEVRWYNKYKENDKKNDMRAEALRHSALFDRYDFYNPTHKIRDLSSDCGLQTSRLCGRRERETDGALPTCLSAGFMHHTNGKAVFFIDVKTALLR